MVLMCGPWDLENLGSPEIFLMLTSKSGLLEGQDPGWQSRRCTDISWSPILVVGHLH